MDKPTYIHFCKPFLPFPPWDFSLRTTGPPCLPRVELTNTTSSYYPAPGHTFWKEEYFYCCWFKVNRFFDCAWRIYRVSYWVWISNRIWDGIRNEWNFNSKLWHPNELCAWNWIRSCHPTLASTSVFVASSASLICAACSYRWCIWDLNCYFWTWNCSCISSLCSRCSRCCFNGWIFYIIYLLNRRLNCCGWICYCSVSPCLCCEQINWNRFIDWHWKECC